MRTKLLVIIVTYNSGLNILKCLESVGTQSYQDYHVYIADNASIDNTLFLIKTFKSNNPEIGRKITVAHNDVNLGFAKAVNKLLSANLRQESPEYVLLLNPDTWFNSDFLHKCVSWLKKDNLLGACCPIITYPDGKIWWIGTHIYRDVELISGFNYGVAEHTLKGHKVLKQSSYPKYVEALTGCAMFIKYEAIKEIGFLNENYFMYAEDLDFSLKLIKNNFKLGLVKNAFVVHDIQDRNKGILSSFLKLRKYTVYLRSIGKFILNHYPFYVFCIWFIKLPFALLFQLKLSQNEK